MNALSITLAGRIRLIGILYASYARSTSMQVKVSQHTDYTCINRASDRPPPPRLFKKLTEVLVNGAEQGQNREQLILDRSRQARLNDSWKIVFSSRQSGMCELCQFTKCSGRQGRFEYTCSIHLLLL